MQNAPKNLPSRNNVRETGFETAAEAVPPLISLESVKPEVKTAIKMPKISMNASPPSRVSRPASPRVCNWIKGCKIVSSMQVKTSRKQTGCCMPSNAVADEMVAVVLKSRLILLNMPYILHHHQLAYQLIESGWVFQRCALSKTSLCE